MTVALRRSPGSLLGLLFLLSSWSCTSIGQYEVSGTARSGPAPTLRSTVLLVVAEGLRQDVFESHLRELIISDNEPQWRSGLSRLALDGFRFASSQRAEAPIGASALTGVATLFTARSPGVHGIVGSRFVSADRHGPRHLYDFTAAHHAAGSWYTAELGKPTADTINELGTLTNEKTWLSRLAESVPVGSAFTRYGAGTTWAIPERRTVGSLAMVHSRTGALAVPILDAAALRATTQLFQTGHRVVVFPFRGIRANSCHRENASCEVATSDLISQQRSALRRLDEALWQVLEQLRLEQPTVYGQLSVVVVGTHGVIDRSAGARPNPIHVIDTQRLRNQLGAQFETQECLKWYEAHGAREIQIVEDGAVARMYLPPCQPGQCFDSRPRQCLAKAVRSMVKKTQWLAGAMWLDDVRADGLPRSMRYKTELRAAFGSSIRAYRRTRLLEKMRRTVDESEARRTGDVVLFASSRWTFESGGSSGYAHEGGLADAAMNIPFFIASPHLTDAAPSSIRTAPLELLDVGPTMYALLGLTPPSGAFNRPAVVRWRSQNDQTLEFVKADRQIVSPAPSTTPQLTWSETADAITIGLSEPKSHWPPETLALSLGEKTLEWKAADGTFANDAPCEFRVEDGRRQWACRFPVDRSENRSLLAQAKRSPGTNGETAQVRSTRFELGDARPAVTELTLACASDDKVGLTVHATDPSGLARIDVYLARSGRSENLVRGATSASVQLGQEMKCPTATPCDTPKNPTELTQRVIVPFKRAQLQRVRWADNVVGQTQQIRQAARRAAAELKLGGQLPESDWLMARVCNQRNRCVQQRLIADTAYRAPTVPECPTP